MSEFTTTLPSTDNVNIVSTPVIPELIITNKVNRIEVGKGQNGVKIFEDELDSDGNKVYNKAFTVVTADLDYEHPQTISIEAVRAIKDDKAQQEKPFICADGSDGEDEALCYVLKGDVVPFPKKKVADPFTGKQRKEPKKHCGNYWPFYGYTPVPATNVDLTQ